MEENKNIEDPKYVKNVYNALKSKVDGFNKTEQEFNESLKDEAYVMNVHNALSKKINGFNKTSDEFKTLMMPLKKKDGTKVPSTSTTETPSMDLVQNDGSLDSKQQNKQSAFSTKKVGLPDASGKLVNPISVNEKTPYENENLRIANKSYDYALSKLDKKTSEDRLSSELNQNEFSDGLKEGAKSVFNSIIGGPLTKINEKLGGNKDFKIGEYKPLQKELILAEKEIRKEKPGVKNISSVEIKDRAEKIFIENDLQTQMNQLIDESLPYGYDREGVFKELKLKEINSNDFLRQKIIGAEVHKKQIEQFTDFEKTINKENPTEQDILQYNSFFEKASIAVKSLKHLEENFDNILKEAKTDGEKLELFKYNYNDFEKFSSNLYTTSLGIIGGASKLAGDTLKYVSPEANKNTPTKVIGNALSGLGDEMMTDANALSNQFYNYKASSLNSFSDLGSFAGQLVSQQLPILGTIYLGGNLGIGAVSMSSGGQKIQELEEQEKSSFGAINYSDGEKLAAGWLYAGAEFFPEKIGTARILKDLERTVASASSASRKLFNQGLIKSIPKAIGKTAFNIGLEGGTEYITAEGQITIDQELLGIIKTDYEKKELRKESTIAGGFMGGAMSIGGGAIALVVSQSKLYSDNNDIREVQSLLKNIEKIQQEIENNSLLTDEEKTSLYKEMNESNNKAFDIVAKNANKGVDLSFQDKSLLVDFNSKQIDLKEKYKEIVNSNFSKEIKDSKIKEIESEFNTLEKNRVKVLNGEYTVLDSMSDSESLKYKNKAAKELLADAKSKGLTDTQINFTEEQINKKAIKIYNDSKAKTTTTTGVDLNAKKGSDVFTSETENTEQTPAEKIKVLETELETITDDNNPRIAEIDAEIIALENEATQPQAEVQEVVEKIPSDEKQLEDVKNGNIVSFTYENKNEIPEIFLDKISSEGNINGNKQIKVTIAKSLADYYLKQNESTQEDITPTDGNIVENEVIKVKPFKKGAGGTLGVFEGEDGKLYKSTESLYNKYNEETREFEKAKTGKITKEHRLLTENQDLKHLPKVGKLVETSEGKAFEIERLNEVEEGSLTFDEINQVQETLDQLNAREVFVNDINTVMRRDNGDIVLIDLSNASDNDMGDETISNEVADLLNKDDRSKYDAYSEAKRRVYLRDLFPSKGKNENEHTYLLTQRPPSIGTHPIDNIVGNPKEIKIGNRTAYKLTYSKPLSVEDISRFELTKETTYEDIGRIFEVQFGKSKMYQVITNVTEDEVTIENYFNSKSEVKKVPQRGVKSALDSRGIEVFPKQKVERETKSEKKRRLKKEGLAKKSEDGLSYESTPSENITPDGNSRIGVEPLGEMGEAGKQEGEVDNKENIQPINESKPTEGKISAVKISVGKYDYTFENGTWTAKDKDGNIKEKNKSTYINKKGKKVKRKEKYIPNKVYEEFAETIDFTEGEKVIDDPYVNGEEYVYEVAKRSKNPAEIAGEIAFAETQDFNENKHPLLLAIAKVLGKKSVSRQSFIDASDINNINQSIGLQYFTPKEKGKGKGIDTIAQEVEIEFYGDYNANEPRVTEEDIVKFIVDNPGGTEKFLNENKNEILDSLKTAFTDVTGLPANQKFLEKAVDQQIEKQNRIAGQDILFAYNQEQLIELSKELDEFKKQENGTETTTNKSDEKISNPENIAESQPESKSKGVSRKQAKGNKRRTDQINDLLDDLDKRLDDFGRNNLGINIAGVVARGAIKAMKLANNGVATLEDVVKAGIDYIKSTDWYQNLDESKQDMINENTLLGILDDTIKENEKSKKLISDLRQKIKDNKSNAKQIVEDIKNFLANNSIDGVLTPAQADALIRKSNDILVATDTLKAFDKFIEYYEKVKTKAENKLNDKAKIKAKYEQQKKQVLDLKAQGKSLADIISILNQSRVKELSIKETQMVELIFKTADVAKMTDEEIKNHVNDMFAASRKIISDSHKPWQRIKDNFKGLRVKFLDAQATAKKIINKSNLTTVTDRLIALKGASAKAEIVFEKAKTKIYSKLNTEQRQKLDEIISLRRIIAIDNNRAKRGLTPLLHSKYVNGEMSQRKLETMEQDMGKEEFDNLNERADFYFDEFRNILNEMEENGLISKQTRDQLFEVDYQPRKFLHHLMNGSEEISENAKAWQKSTYGLSGDQILKLDQGSVEAMVLNSEWLLATAVSMRQKSMFMNKLNTKLATEFNKKATEIEALRQKPNKTKAEINQIKEFNNLSEIFIPNPIVGVTKSGNPKYKYNSVKPGYRNAYYYVNGVQQKIMMKEEIYEQWFGEKKFINNPKATENLAKWTGSRLLKTMATGRNPFFFITNTPRDFVNTLIVSPEYSKFKLLAGGQLIKDLLKSFVAIKNKKDSFEKYFEYGGGMSFLSSEGMLTGKSLTREILENSKNKTVKTILDANIKEKAGKVLDWVTLHELNQYSELIFRIAIFDRTVKNELGKINEEGKKLNPTTFKEVKEITDLSKEEQEDIYFRAVASARSVMDFNQGGYITKDMESVMPYLNAATQGSRVLMDAFIERPIETTSNILQLTAMGVTGAMGMSIALLGYGKDDDDERTSTQIYLENLEMVSPYDRRNFFIVFTGRKDEDGNPEYLKFAKAQQITPFTQIAEHHTENYFRNQYGLKEKDNLLEKSLSAVNDNISPIQFMSFKDDPSLVGISLMARNPFGRAAMNYATGYDFYRQEKLSWDIDNKDVPKYMEGYTSDRVDDFYKELGQDLKISPIRTKAFVESIVTSPGTNPYIGIMYAGLDAAMSDDTTKDRLKILRDNTLKNIGKRAIGVGKPYNVTLEEKEKLKEQIEDIQAENIIFNKKVDDIAKGFINKTESRKVLVDRLRKELKLEPFKAERAVKRLEDKIKFSDVDQFYLDLKYENNNEVKALMIFNKFGDISKLSPEKRKEAGKQLEDISFKFNDETANKYRELLIEFEER